MDVLFLQEQKKLSKKSVAIFTASSSCYGNQGPDSSHGESGLGCVCAQEEIGWAPGAAGDKPQAPDYGAFMGPQVCPKVRSPPLLPADPLASVGGP